MSQSLKTGNKHIFPTARVVIRPAVRTKTGDGKMMHHEMPPGMQQQDMLKRSDGS